MDQNSLRQQDYKQGFIAGARESDEKYQRVCRALETIKKLSQDGLTTSRHDVDAILQAIKKIADEASKR